MLWEMIFFIFLFRDFVYTAAPHLPLADLPPLSLCPYACMHMMYIHNYIHIRIQLYTHTSTIIQTHVHNYIHIRLLLYKHVYTIIYIYVYVYTTHHTTPRQMTNGILQQKINLFRHRDSRRMAHKMLSSQIFAPTASTDGTIWTLISERRPEIESRRPQI